MICITCKQDKEDDFRKSRKVCRECDNNQARENRKKAKTKPKPEFIICRQCNEKKTEFRVNRRKCLDCERAHGRKYRQETDKAKIWTNNNRDQMAKLVRDWQAVQRKNNPKWNAMANHRNSIAKFLRGAHKSKYVNCTGEHFRNWIQFQFSQEMSLDNHSSYWVLDHVIPIKTFLDGDYSEEIVLNWMNVRPVIKEDNQKKHKNIDPIIIQNHLENVKHYTKIRKLDEDKDYISILANICETTCSGKPLRALTTTLSGNRDGEHG